MTEFLNQVVEPLFIVANTIALIILTKLFFFQKNKLEYMEKAMRAVDIEKIVASQEYILKSEILRIEDESRKKIAQSEIDILAAVNKNKIEQANSYDELYALVFGILASKDVRQQEAILASIPNTAELMRLKLAQHEAGISDVVQQGEENHSKP